MSLMLLLLKLVPVKIALGNAFYYIYSVVHVRIILRCGLPVFMAVVAIVSLDLGKTCPPGDLW